MFIILYIALKSYYKKINSTNQFNKSNSNRENNNKLLLNIVLLTRTINRR
jgi:archaellum component FlaF (FlaF/FlaG flagellin family)